MRIDERAARLGRPCPRPNCAGVPVDATVTGVQARILAAQAGTGGFVFSVCLVVGGVAAGNDLGDAAPLDHGVGTWLPYGGSGNLWGLSLTPAQVNAANFGVAFEAESGQTTQAYVNPAGASTGGFEITVYYTTADGKDLAVRLIRADGTFGTTNKASASAWPTSDTVATYGTSSDLWGESLTPDIVNSAAFGVMLQATCPTTSAALSVDDFTLRVYYTQADVQDSQLQLVLGGVMVGQNKADLVSYWNRALPRWSPRRSSPR